MKRIWMLVLLAVCVSFLMTGCSFWMDGAYSSVSKNHSSGGNRNEGVVVVSSYQQMCDALSEIVEECTQKSLLYVTELPESSIKYIVDMAIDYVLRTNPIGAYAVNQISYEIGTNMGKPAVSLDIDYRHTRAEVLRIKQAQNMDVLFELILLSLEKYEDSTVIHVKNYRNRDLIQNIEDYIDLNPQNCLETPHVSVSMYPELGQERVIEISFSYQTSRDTLRMMQQSVNDIFMSAQLYINPGAEDMEKYNQLYAFLMERYDYTVETSITPAYSLLRHGVGDSKAFATVFAAMCRQVELDCQVVSGTKLGVPWHWNAIKIDEVYYHLDLLECDASGSFVMKLSENMQGYVWDYSAF